MFAKIHSLFSAIAIHFHANRCQKAILRNIKKDSLRCGQADIVTEDASCALALGCSGGLIFGIDPLLAIDIDAAVNFRSFSDLSRQAVVVKYRKTEYISAPVFDLDSYRKKVA